MHSIVWLLLFAPPCLALLTWLMTRGWTAMIARGNPRPWIAVWQKYDFWVILAILYIVMWTAAVVEHKL